jgi:PST family polysaccharide transporter
MAMNYAVRDVACMDHSQKGQVVAKSASGEPYLRANHPGDSLGAAAIRGGSWVLLAQAICTGVRVVSSIILARLLMPADFGLYAMVVAVSAGLLIFKDLGLCDAIIQWPNLTDRQISSLFWVNLGMSLAIAACLAVVSPVLSRFYGEPRLAGIAVVWSLTIVFGALSAQHLALLKRAMLFAGVSKLVMVAAIISNVGAVALAWHGAGYWALVLREVMNEAVTATGAWFLCRWRPQRFSRRSGIRPMLVFGGHSVASFIIRRTTRNLDRTLLGWRFGPVATGYYHMAFEQAAMFTSLITEPLRNVAVSSLSKLREHPERFRQHYLKAIAGVAFASFAATVVLVAASGDLVAILLGPKWQPAGDILRILGLSAGVSAIYMTNIWLHFSLGRADRMARWTILEVALIGVGVTVGLRFGARGVAWGYCVSMFFLCIPGILYAGRPVGLALRDMIAALWRPAVAAVVAGFACWYVVLTTGFVQAHSARIVIFCALFGSVYVCLVVILSGGIKPVRSSLDFLKSAYRRVGR